MVNLKGIKQMAKLKIGILIDDMKLEKYKVEILNELKKSDSCVISKFIKVDKQALTDEGIKYLFYRLFNKIDAKLFGRDIKYLGLETIDTALDEKEPDVIINLTNSTMDYPNSAKYGMWQFVYNSLPAGYFEVVNNDPFTQVTLQKSGNGFENGYILNTFKTATDRKSMIKNRDLTAWRSHMMIVRELEKLASKGGDYFDDKESILDFNHECKKEEKKFFDPQFGFSDDKKLNPPKNCEMFRVICKLLKKYATFSIRKFFPMDRWLILYSENKNGEMNSKLSDYKRFYAPSQNHFIADPFVVDEDDKSYLFYEELNYDNAKGYLKVAQYDDEKGIFKESETILEQEYHLSYPNVFKLKGTYYMIPESYEKRSVDLFEAVEFPTKWKKKKTLLDNVSAVDATLYFHDKTWWMFVSIAPKEDFSMNDELYIYHCKDFLKDAWIPHVQNPVVCDVTSARPAGNLIKKGDKLYRPAQDCSGIYGRKLVINEVLVLNEFEYKEKLAGGISSDFADDLAAVHTLNSSKKLTVIDAIKSR